MCGRAAQTANTVALAANILQQHANQNDYQISPGADAQNDRYNLAPGGESVIFHALNQKSSSEASSDVANPKTLTSSSKIWGLCPKNGTINHPLEEGPGKHFSNLMYNARSDTLYEKRTFSKLAQESQTCLWPIDGYYEWKQDEGNVLSNSKGKQPYFVKSGKTDMPLFLVGLWNRVKTGRKVTVPVSDSGKCDIMQEQDEFIETFTLITTEACSSLSWMHHRQPIMIYNLDLAIEWLFNPSNTVLQKMRQEASGLSQELAKGDKEKNIDGYIQWYPVTKSMSKLGYKSKDCMDPVKIEKIASVKSFFTAGGAKPKVSTKRSLSSAKMGDGNDNSESSSSPKKMKSETKKGVSAFFSPRDKATTSTSSPKKTSIRKSPVKKVVPKKGSIQTFFKKA